MWACSVSFFVSTVRPVWLLFCSLLLDYLNKCQNQSNIHNIWLRTNMSIHYTSNSWCIRNLLHFFFSKSFLRHRLILNLCPLATGVSSRLQSCMPYLLKTFYYSSFMVVIEYTKSDLNVFICLLQNKRYYDLSHNY